MEQALSFLESHVEEPVTLDRLAAAVGLSSYHLQRRFKSLTGLSPKEYHTALKLRRFRHSVRDDRDVTRATFDAGFGSSRGLYEQAPVGLGMTPGRYARQGAGLQIAYALEDCTLGRALVATTSRGVCAVFLGDDDEDLCHEVQTEFCRADLNEAPHARSGWVAAVLAHIDDTRVPLAVPLDAHGTPFQVRVWRALRKIPVGQSRTYADLAQAVGSPRAVRAVGSACAHNVIAVLVPCHRVLRRDGRIGGYRWGVDRKQRLLEREGE